MQQVTTGPRKHGASRAALLDSARSLLRQTSYDGFSAEAVAHDAGLSRRTLYNHFINREQLYRASREQLIHELSREARADLDAGRPMRAALQDFTLAALRLLGDDRHIETLTSIIRDGDSQSWLAESYNRLIKHPLYTALELWLHHHTGELAPLDVRLTALQFVSSIETIAVSPRLFSAPLRLSAASAEDQASALVDAFFAQHQRRAAA